MGGQRGDHAVYLIPGTGRTVRTGVGNASGTGAERCGGEQTATGRCGPERCRTESDGTGRTMWDGAVPWRLRGSPRGGESGSSRRTRPALALIGEHRRLGGTTQSVAPGGGGWQRRRLAAPSTGRSGGGGRELGAAAPGAGSGDRGSMSLAAPPGVGAEHRRGVPVFPVAVWKRQSRTTRAAEECRKGQPGAPGEELFPDETSSGISCVDLGAPEEPMSKHPRPSAQGNTGGIRTCPLLGCACAVPELVLCGRTAGNTHRHGRGLLTPRIKRLTTSGMVKGSNPGSIPGLLLKGPTPGQRLPNRREEFSRQCCPWHPLCLRTS